MGNHLFVIFAVLVVSLAVNLCINCSFFYIYYHITVKILLDFDKIWCTTACVERDEVFKSTIAES